MELRKLFDTQEAFEKKIIESTNIEENALGEENIQAIIFLALQVKIGELANLTKCYKYFKVKANLPKHKLMIRHADALRYLLSIGNKYQFNMISLNDLSNPTETENVIQIFSKIYDDMTELKKHIISEQYVDGLNTYIRIFSNLIHLGKILGLSEKEVFMIA